MAEPLGYMFNRTSANPIETDRQVNNITLRDAIVAGKRWQGMLVHVLSENKTYELNGGIDNTNWIEFGAGSPTNPPTHYRGDFDATALDPAIDNSNGVAGDEYRVINGGVNVNFGSGNIFLNTLDILVFHNNVWMVKVKAPLEIKIDGLFVPLEGKTSFTLWEVDDTFRGWIESKTRYVEGKIISITGLNMPADIDDDTKVKLAINNYI